MKEIDLSRFAPRSDLADEIITGSNETHEYSVINKKYKDVNISYITIHKDNNSFNKKKGDYVSIEFQNIEDQKNRDVVKDVLVDNLKIMIQKFSLNDNSKVLVVGLGNEEMVSDSIGPKTINQILVSAHLFELNEKVHPGINNCAAIAPKVMGQTGLESAKIVKAIVDFYKPNFFLVVDA